MGLAVLVGWGIFRTGPWIEAGVAGRMMSRGESYFRGGVAHIFGIINRKGNFWSVGYLR